MATGGMGGEVPEGTGRPRVSAVHLDAGTLQAIISGVTEQLRASGDARGGEPSARNLENNEAERGKLRCGSS